MTKKQLPLSSKADFSKGVWMVFNSDQHIVRVWLSLLTGKEIIYINDEAVSQRRNITSFNTVDSINHRGDHFDVEIDTESLAPYKLNCSVFINGEYIETQRVTQEINTATFTIQTEKGEKSIQRMLERYLSLGKKELAEYDLGSAESHFNKALMIDDKSGEVYYFKACIASLNEEIDNAFELLEKAISLGLNGKNRILEDDNLAFIRVLERFESFCDIHLRNN